MGLCLGTCSICIKTQTKKSTAGWLCSIALVVGCLVPSHPTVVVMLSCRRHVVVVVVIMPWSTCLPLLLVAVSSHCGVPCRRRVVSYPVIVVSCHTYGRRILLYSIVGSCHVVVIVFVVVGMPFIVRPGRCGIC